MKVILIKFTVKRLTSDAVCLNRVGCTAGSDVGEVSENPRTPNGPFSLFEKCYANRLSPYDGKTFQTFVKHIEKEVLAKKNPLEFVIIHNQSK